MLAVAHRHTPPTLRVTSPNLGEEFSERVCLKHKDKLSRCSTILAVTYRHTPQSLCDNSPSLGEQLSTNLEGEI